MYGRKPGGRTLTDGLKGSGGAVVGDRVGKTTRVEQLSPAARRPDPLLAETGLPDEDATPSSRLEPDAREDLEEAAKLNIMSALVAYYSAADAVGERVREKAAKSPWILDLLVDVLAAVTLKGITVAVLKRIATGLAGRSGELLIDLFTSEGGDPLAKELFGAAMSETTSAIKGSYADLGKDDAPTAKFIDGLKQGARTALTRLARMCTTNVFDDETLLSIAAAYDPDTLTDAVLKERIYDLVKRFESQIEPIGSTRKLTSYAESGSSKTYRFAWVVRANGAVQPALVAFRHMTAATTIGDWELETWISPEMLTAARAQANGDEMTIKESELENLKSSEERYRQIQEIYES